MKRCLALFFMGALSACATIPKSELTPLEAEEAERQAVQHSIGLSLRSQMVSLGISQPEKLAEALESRARGDVARSKRLVAELISEQPGGFSQRLPDSLRTLQAHVPGELSVAIGEMLAELPASAASSDHPFSRRSSGEGRPHRKEFPITNISSADDPYASRDPVALDVQRLLILRDERAVLAASARLDGLEETDPRRPVLALVLMAWFEERGRTAAWDRYAASAGPILEASNAGRLLLAVRAERSGAVDVADAQVAAILQAPQGLDLVRIPLGASTQGTVERLLERAPVDGATPLDGTATALAIESASAECANALLNSRAIEEALRKQTDEGNVSQVADLLPKREEGKRALAAAQLKVWSLYDQALASDLVPELRTAARNAARARCDLQESWLAQTDYLWERLRARGVGTMSGPTATASATE